MPALFSGLLLPVLLLSLTATELDPFEAVYLNYRPDFVVRFAEEQKGRNAVPANKLKLSTETTFYTLTLLPEVARANSLVEAAMKKEKEGQFREALEIYQKVLDEYPDALYRVSASGVFVPVTLYYQLRLLRFPAPALQLYRTRHDARAKEAYESAVARNSVEGLAEIRDTMLATSFGAKAVEVLGDAALDRGNHLEALEYYRMLRQFFPDSGLRNTEVELKEALCRKLLGEKNELRLKPTDESSVIQALHQLLSRARYELRQAVEQYASASAVAADDYAHFPPTSDPLGLDEPVWQHPLPGSRLEFYVFTQPVAAGESIIYRHKNIVYCRSIITGELRWKNDLGGRVTWQNRDARQYPHEDLLVHEGLVFTPMYKVGPTLVALDLVTGQLRWAYGPMTASSEEEARLRFECAPAAGPRSVYASYIQDNIIGDTHVDSEYGVMAFDTTTGQVLWRREVCRLRPEKFAGGFAVRYRNRIRSFASPPLYSEGTVYYCSNAGAIAALDALSGRIKWCIRYPYYAYPHSVHDATRQFGGLEMYENNPLRHHRPMFWYAQRPLLAGEDLYVLPVDSPLFFSIDRRTGKVRWSRYKPDDGSTYFMGLAQGGELILVNSFRRGGGVHLVDPTTGETVWVSGDPLERIEHPVMNYYYDFGSGRSLGAMFGRWDYQVAARPFLTQDGRIYFTSFKYWAYPVWGWSCNLCMVDLAERKVIGRRRYFSGEILARAASDIAQAPGLLKTLEELPHKDEATKQRMREYAEIAQDTVPVNEFGPFLPFSRLTLLRHGTRFELRTGPRTIAMVYDREALKRSLAGRNDTAALFARAELALGENRFDEAATLMEQCLSSLSSEDVDLHALVNQQLHEVYRRLASRAIRRGNVNQEVSHCANMHRTVVTLTQEIETLFALAEAYERKGELKRAAALLQSIIATYGHYHHLSPALASGDREALTARAGEIIATAESFAGNLHYGELFRRSLRLMRKELPLFFGTLSPIRRDLTVRAGDLAAAKLITLYGASPEFASSFEREAEAAFSRAGPEEQMARLAEYPCTGAAQRVLDALFARLVAKPASNITEAASTRKQLWQLTDLARLSGLVVPKQIRSRVLPSPEVKAPPPLQFPMVNQTSSVAEERGTAWLVLERHGATTVQPDRLFLAGRVKKKFDNKFVLHAFELGSGRIVWKAQEQRGEEWFDEIRLKDKGDEPGFFEAFVSTNLVVVNGRYDVLAFSLSDGRLRWRYTVPFSFEIKHALLSGDLLALAGQNETIMLYIPTDDPRGEVFWQEKEEGDLYCAPWFYGDTLVSVRKMPFNLTVRARGTDRLIGRLALPDLSLCTAHPLLPDGPEAVPLAHDGRFLVVTDGWYYIMLDVERMRVMWKRLIDANDVTREPAMRLVRGGEYLAVLKEDYDVKNLYMLSSRTGEVLWHTDPRNPERFSPIHSMFIVDGKLFGIRPHAGQGFYLVCRDCRTGKDVFSPYEQLGYESRPQVSLRDRLYGHTLVALIRDRQDFEVRAFDALDGRLLHTLRVKATGDFGEHGRASATVQNGHLILLGGNELATARSK